MVSKTIKAEYDIGDSVWFMADTPVKAVLGTINKITVVITPEEQNKPLYAVYSKEMSDTPKGQEGLYFNLPLYHKEDVGESYLFRNKKDLLSKMKDIKQNSTCKKCPDNQICDYAYDEYNVNGDCLATK